MNYEITQTHEGHYKFTLHENFEFELGGSINPLEIVYETYGELSPQHDNVILIHHALSPSHHVASHSEEDKPGWWENMVGSNKPINSNRYFIICIGNIGSCYGSSSPVSIDPKTQKPYRTSFPTLTMNDIVRSQKI